MSIEVKRFSPKRTVEHIVYTIDFKKVLGTDIILTASVTAVVAAGTADANPNAIVSGNAVIDDDGKEISQMIIDGVDGTTYGVLFKADTEDNQIIVGVGILEVTDKVLPL